MRPIFLLFPVIILVSACSLLPTDKLSLTGESRREEVEKAAEKVETPSIEKSLYKSAQEAENKGEFTKSGYLYQQLVQRYPGNDVYKFHYAEIMRRMGNCKGAVNLYDELLVKNKENLDYLEAKGLCLLADTKFQEAGDIFTKIIRTDANRWKSINGAGLIFAANNKYQEANQYLDMAATVSNQNPAVLNNQALLKALIGNTQDGIRIMKDASFRAAGEPGQKRHVDLNLALIYAISGNLDSAESTARPHLTEPQLYNNMGIYAELAKDKELAKTYLNKALMGTSIYYDKAWENLERLEKN